MATYQHPGIYIEEIPSARSIQAASTSTAAFVGVTESGPSETPTLVTSWNQFTREFGGLIWNGFLPWAVYEFFLEGGSICYVVRARDNGNGAQANAKLSDTTFVAASMGTWGNDLAVQLVDASKSTGSNSSPVFNVQVLLDKSKLTPPSGGTSDPDAERLKAFALQNKLATINSGGKDYYLLESFNGFTDESVGSGAMALRINTSSTFIRVQSSGKKRPSVTGVKPFTSGVAASLQLTDAMNTLETVQGISLLAMPDTVTATDAGGKPSQSTQADLINQGLLFCETLGSLFYTVDPPFGLNVQDILGFKTGTSKGSTTALNSSYGAIYYPWVWIFNPINNTNVPVPPSGPCLGRYAYSDQNPGVWQSPAGVNNGALQTVTAVQTPVTENDQDVINPEGINALRNLINYGNVIYGARTLSMDSQWTYISVRRLFIFVEQSLKQSLQWVVFQPNNQQLWSSVSRDISSFLTTLWQQGGLMGSTAKEAFFVTCDASNNPPETQALGQLFIDIGLAAVYPAEFVIIRITQKTAGPDSGN